MQKQLLFSFLCLIAVISCTEKNDQNYYDQCGEGDRRCSGNKLEQCSSYNEWYMLIECDAFGGTCISEGNSFYCSELPDDIDADSFITDWGEEEDDFEETGNDSSIWSDLVNSDDDGDPGDDDIADIDGIEFDEDIYDADITDEDNAAAVCGNTVVEEGEVCEKGTLKSCIELDPSKYSGGKAFCFDDCSGYNVITCDEIEVGDSD